MLHAGMGAEKQPINALYAVLCAQLPVILVTLSGRVILQFASQEAMHVVQQTTSADL